MAEERKRFVISHRLAGSTRSGQRQERLAGAVARHLAPHLDLLSSPRQARGSRRSVFIVEGDPETLRRKGQELPGSALVEPLIPRRLARVDQKFVLGSSAPPVPAGPGLGATYELTLVSTGGAPVGAANVSLQLVASSGAFTQATATSDPQGRVAFEYDPAAWSPAIVIVTPLDSIWSSTVASAPSGTIVTLEPLPTNGPQAWWHALSGASAWSSGRGSGIRIGIADTGVGPNPDVGHVKGLGALSQGSFTAGAAAARDVDVHGTHVAGVIAARPPAGSGRFGGLAAGAEVAMIRIFGSDGDCSQVDTSLAIDRFAEAGTDLVSLSVTGEASVIEQDAIQAAYEKGALCICAAGNEGAGTPDFPSAYPEAVSVAALGRQNCMPANSLAALMQPTDPTRIGEGGTFLARFSNYGPGLGCAAAGNGVISTVPANALSKTPQVDLSGTSVATPMVAAALAAALAGDQAYLKCPRDPTRADRARSVLEQLSISVGLSTELEGKGVPQISGKTR